MSERKNHNQSVTFDDEDELYKHTQPNFIIPLPNENNNTDCHGSINNAYARGTADPNTTHRISAAVKSKENSTKTVETLPHQQLRTLQATTIICGAMSGVGVLSMPSALARTGWFGVALLVVMGAATCYTGNLLAKCWMMLQRNCPEYAVHCRYPYPSIAQQALGRAGRIGCSIVINLTLFGAGIVFIVLAAQNTQEFLFQVWGVNKSLCMYIIIWGLIYMPVTWLGSPKDFWQLNWGAWLATTVVLFMIFITVLLDHSHHPNAHTRKVDPVTVQSFFFGFGTFMFAFGIHSVLPNIHHDMKKSSDFKKSLILAFVITTAQYIPVPILWSRTCDDSLQDRSTTRAYSVVEDSLESIVEVLTITLQSSAILSLTVFGHTRNSYALYGHVESNILLTMPKGPVQYVAVVLITSHVLLAINSIWNTVFQEIEHLVDIPQGFSLQRIGARCSLTLLATFLALSIPHFGVLLGLIGGFCTTTTTFVLPPTCYFILMRKWSTAPIPVWEKVIMGLIVLLGVVGILVSTYSGFHELITSPTFTAPCYTAAWSHYGANGNKTGTFSGG